ncbi:MAG: TraM recognition domain-containing protein [Varibaculum sp.]
MRGRNMSVSVILQTISQIKRSTRTSGNITANCDSKLFLGSNDEQPRNGIAQYWAIKPFGQHRQRRTRE